MALPHVLAVAFITTGLTGCALLDLLLGIPPFPDPDASFEPFPFPSAEATFTTGQATIQLDGEIVVLDEVVRGGSMEDFGLNVTWRNGDGWYLTYFGFPDLGMLGASAYLSLDRVSGTQHWIIRDQTRCVTTTERADAGGLAGTAVCRGLKWSDYFSSISGVGVPEEIPGQPAFDADITFDAR